MIDENDEELTLVQQDRSLNKALRYKFQMLPTISQSLTLQDAFETVAQINEELIKRTEFCKKFKLLIDSFLHFFGRVNDPSKEKSRSLNPGKAIAMVICPVIVHFIT